MNKYIVVPITAGVPLMQPTIPWRARSDADHVAKEVNEGKAVFTHTWPPKPAGWSCPYNGWGVIEETKNEWGDIFP